MSTPTIIYFAFLWYCIGCFSFWYWFTLEHIIDSSIDYFMMFCAGFFGVFSWFIGNSIHGKNYNIFGIMVK